MNTTSPELLDLVKKLRDNKVNEKVIEQVKIVNELWMNRIGALVDQLEIGLLQSDREYAEKFNFVCQIHLKETTNLVGESLCRELYDFTGNDKVQLIDESKMSSEVNPQYYKIED